MTSLKTAFMALLLAGLLSAFNLSSYIYPTEKNVTVAYTNFTLDGSNYSLVAFNGVNTFLLQNDEPLRNQSDIAQALFQYYSMTYYPSADELANLSAAIKRFNDSRNDGYGSAKYKEEYTCRESLFMSGRLKYNGTPVTCTDADSCKIATMYLYAYGHDAFNWGSAALILQPVMDFGIPSFQMDAILSNYTYKLANLNQDNVASTMDYIKNTAGTLKSDSLQIESTIFRTPRMDDPADRAACKGICNMLCPPFDLDQDAADQIKSIATALSNKVAPLKNFNSFSQQIADNSAARLAYAKNESTAAYYTDMFRGLNASGSEAIALGKEAKKHVLNGTLNAALDRLMALHATIPDDIADRNFANTEADIANYTQSTRLVKNLSLQILGAYNATLDAKNTADSVMLLLETKDLDPGALETFQLLQNRTADLDASFRDGYTVSQLQALRLNYTNVSAEAHELLKSESDAPAGKAVLLFRGFARRVNGGIAKFAIATGLGDGPAIAANSLLSFGGFSTLVFLSLSSLSLLFFLYILVSFTLDIPQSRYVLGAAFISTLVLFLGFSVFLFIFLDKTSASATLTEFLSDFNSQNSTSIMVDLRNVSYSDAQSMGNCADSLSSLFSQANKTWTIYYITPNTCTERNSAGANSSLTAAECLGLASNESSSFVLGYAAQNEPPKFSIIYQSRAEIRANSDYYKSCPLVALFG